MLRESRIYDNKKKHQHESWAFTLQYKHVHACMHTIQLMENLFWEWK